MKLIILIMLLYIPYCTAQKIYIIIHGTWAVQHEWFAPRGDFYEALSQADPTSSIVPFCWSGTNNHVARITAAHILCALLHSYPPDTHFILIGHSHGGNVAIHATRLLAKTESSICIESLFTLGTPIDPIDPLPDMSIVKRVYNVFSLDDYIQPIFGMFKRIFPSHERIENIRVIIDTNKVDHSMLHHALIGKIIPEIPDLVTSWRTSDTYPILLFLNKDGYPLCSADIERDQLIAQDTSIFRYFYSSA